MIGESSDFHRLDSDKSSDSENRCMFRKARTATFCARARFERLRLIQEVDIGLSGEIAFPQRFAEPSRCEKNRCILLHRSVGSIGGNSIVARGPAGTVSVTILGTAGSAQLEDSRILRFSTR